jgi:hypothetical protein
MTWRRRVPGSPQPDGRDDRPITPEDVAWRIGASDARPAHPSDAMEGPDDASAAVDGTPAKAATRRDTGADRRALHAHPVVSGTTRRIILWRDASAVLFVVIAVAFVAQLVLSRGPDQTAAIPTGGGSALPTQAALGSSATPGVTEGVPTIGPVVDPSLIPNIEATPTPIPTPRPTSTPRPTPRPTVKPSSAPTAPPPPATPVVTPTPAPPIAVIAASPQCGPAPLSVAFDASASSGATAYAWDFDDPNGGNRSDASVDHVFDGGRLTYNVTLTVTGPGGSDAAFVTIHVPCA